MNEIDTLIDNVPAPKPAAEAPAPKPEPEDVPRETLHEEPEDDTPENPEAKPEESETENTDEYGNETVKQEKTYTEAQVQAMIRDRLSRGQHAQQEPPKQQEQQPQSKDFQYDENSSQSWEQQLEQFMDGWASKREQKQQQQQWQQAEQQKQAEFEGRFNSGMAKYNDFRDVVGNQPIDDTMLIATRGMKDPAAFLYAAAKKQPSELQRIAQIADPYVKMTEIGRLDERMRKQRSTTSAAPKPASKTKGDTVGKPESTNLDDKIRRYAEKNLRRG
jgi:hypothetical protein